MTTITGYIYNALGQTITQGHLKLTLQQDMVSVEGTKVAPFTVTINLASTAGLVNVTLYATQGATPGGLAYFAEFDPDPTDTSKPMRSKNGYWYNYWPVPDAPSVTLGSFTSAERGRPYSQYAPLSGATAPGNTFDIGAGTATTKTIFAKQGAGTNPAIRYNAALQRWEFSNDGITFTAM